MNGPVERVVARALPAFVASVWMLALFGTSQSAAEQEYPDATYAHTYVGAVDEDLFIGVLVEDPPAEDGRRALVVYLCDGADVATWIFDETFGASAVVENDAARVEISLGRGGVFGVVELAGGERRAFVADAATDHPGLYRAVETFDGREYVGGWIVLDDGRQRGAITLRGDVVENPEVEPIAGVAESSIGTFGSNCFINPHTGERVCRYLQLR
jgi:hypothetical protein